ncbi:hypothetical protein TcBrA4_0139720 [Trypanosoma cruzi]|nr:hypothetical protein TcBrA4_0139720 [Trypanosoma cruzi]
MVRQACAFILWTDEKTLLQLWQGDVDPLLVVLRGGAVDTPGGGSEEVGAVLLLQCGRAAPPTQRVACNLQGACRPARSGQEDVKPAACCSQGVAVLTSGRGSGGGRALTRSQECRSTADPRGQERGAPCLGASQAWDREGTKLFRTGLWQHGEAMAEGMIAVLPLAEQFSLWQAAAATHSACSTPSVQIPVGLSRLPLVRCLGAFPTT